MTNFSDSVLKVIFFLFFFTFSNSSIPCPGVLNDDLILFHDDFETKDDSNWINISGNTSTLISNICGSKDGTGNSLVFIESSPPHHPRKVTSKWIDTSPTSNFKEFFDITESTVHLKFYYIGGRSTYPSCDPMDYSFERAHVYVYKNTSGVIIGPQKIMEIPFDYGTNSPIDIDIDIDIVNTTAVQIEFRQDSYEIFLDLWAIDDIYLYHENMCGFPVNGICNTDIGICNCSSNYYGNACEFEFCFINDTKMNYDYCSNHGKCKKTIDDITIRKCHCDEGYYSEYCENAICLANDEYFQIFFDDFTERRVDLWVDMNENVDLGYKCSSSPAATFEQAKTLTTRSINPIIQINSSYILSFWFVIGRTSSYYPYYSNCLKRYEYSGYVTVSIISETEEIIELKRFDIYYNDRRPDVITIPFQYDGVFRLRFHQNFEVSSVSMWAIDNVSLRVKDVDGCYPIGGTCVDSSLIIINTTDTNTSLGQCDCNDGYEGYYCSYTECGEMNEELFCSFRGKCVWNSSLVGYCVCNENYIGDICQFELLKGRSTNEEKQKEIIIEDDFKTRKNDLWEEMEGLTILVNDMSCGGIKDPLDSGAIFKFDVRSLSMKNFIHLNSHEEITFTISFWIKIGADTVECENAEEGDGVYLYLITRGHNYIDGNETERSNLLQYFDHDYTIEGSRYVEIEFTTSKNFKIQFQQSNFLYGSDVWALSDLKISTNDLKLSLIIPIVYINYSGIILSILLYVVIAIVVIILVIIVLSGIIFYVYLKVKNRKKSVLENLGDTWENITTFTVNVKSKYFKKKSLSNWKDREMVMINMAMSNPTKGEEKRKVILDSEVKKVDVDVAKGKLDFLFEQDECFFDLEICFRDSVKVFSFRSLFVQCDKDLTLQKNTRSLKIDFPNEQLKNVDSEDINKVLFGEMESLDNVDKIFDLYVFFQKMNYIPMLYVLCKKVNENLKVKSMLQLFRKCLQKFELFEKKELTLDQMLEEEAEETPIDPSSNFKCALTLAAFNAMKDNFDDILIKDRFVAFLCALNYWKRLSNYSVVNVREHEEFLSPSSSLRNFNNFKDIFRMTIANLFRSKKYANLTLKTKDNKLIKVHKEILLSKSNFFHSMIKFDGSESNSLNENSTIKIDILNSNVLKELIEYIYMGVINSNEITTLCKLLEHSEMFLDKKLQNILKNKIKKYFNINKSQFLNKIIEHSWRVKKMPTHITKEFRTFFKSEITKSNISYSFIDKLINISQDQKGMKNEIMKLKMEIKLLNEELEEQSEYDSEDESEGEEK